MIAPAAAAFAKVWAGPRAARFRRALSACEQSQRAVAAEITAALAVTAYGRRVGCSPTMAYEGFAGAIPIARFAAFSEDIKALEAGAANQLWPGRPVAWEATSGSSGPKKPIPIGARLRRAFAEAVFIQAHDLLASGVWRPRSGRIALAIAPPVPGRALAQDASFLTGPLGLLARRFLVAPAALGQIAEPGAFVSALARVWAAARDLELITLWNPSYMLVLLDEIAQQLGGEPDWKALWPNLQLISAWDGAMAGPPAAALRRRLPHVFLQGKGLLCTEGPVTIPLIGVPAPVPFVDGALIELQDLAGAVRPLWLAEEGATYRLIVSWPGGFCRYDLGDLVRVTGRIGDTPCLTFLGRADAVCDLVGEKLAEHVAAAALSGVLSDRFGFLAPHVSPEGRAHYRLVAEAAAAEDAAALDARLGENVHYARARALRQLGPIEPMPIADLRRVYQAACAATGQSLEAIKDRAVIVDPARADSLLAAISRAAAPPPPPASG